MYRKIQVYSFPPYSLVIHFFKSLINFANFIDDNLVRCFQNAFSNQELIINYGDDS